MAKQIRSGLMSEEAAGMAVETLSARIEVFDKAINLKIEHDEDDDGDLLGGGWDGDDPAESLASDCEDVEQLRRIRAQLIEAKEALEAAA